MITLLSPQSAAHLHNYPGDHVENEKKKPTAACTVWIYFAGGHFVLLIQTAKKETIIRLTVKLQEPLLLQDLAVLLGDTQAAFRQQHRRANRRHDSHGVDEARQRREHFDGGTRCWSANVRTYRGSRSERGVFFFLLLGASCFFPLLAEKLWPSQSFSAGDQRRHVWRRSCRCSPGWKLHSCRSGLFSLGHRSQNNTA